MKYKLLDLLACPVDNYFPLQVYALKKSKDEMEKEDEIEEGILLCPHCKRYFPIRETIPQLLPDELRTEEDLEFLRRYWNLLPSEIQKMADTFHKDLLNISTKNSNRETQLKRSEMLQRDKQIDVVDSSRYMHQSELQSLIAHFDLTKEHRLLDAGAGRGRFIWELFPHCREVVALDYSFLSLKKLTEEAREKSLPNIHTIQADLSFLPLRKTELFDRIISCQVFEHLSTEHSRRQSLFAIKSRMTKEGIFVITVYNYPIWYWFSSYWQKEGYHAQGKIYFYRFSKKELNNMLGGIFHIEEICGIGCLHFGTTKLGKLAVKLDKLLSNFFLSTKLGHLLLAKCFKA